MMSVLLVARAWRAWREWLVAVLVDDLVAWLVGLLGDAGRKGLVKLVFGTDLERALAAAAEAAVLGTGAELRPDDGESAEELARVIGQVFTARGPRELDLAGGRTLLEAITGGVSVQVGVLGDPELTGQDVSSADVLGIPAELIAERLTAHLVAEIRLAALTDGALKPLADRIDHDAAYQRDRWTAGVLASVDAGVRAILGRAEIQPVTATAEEFASDVRALLESLAEEAARGRMPPYLRGHADVLALSREVKVRAGIRNGTDDGAGAASGRAYTLAADRHGHQDRIMPWPEVAAHARIVVLADPGLGKSWLVRTETRRLADIALSQAGDDLSGAVIPVPLRCDQLAAAEGPDLPCRAACFLAEQGLLAVRSRGPMTELIRGGRAVILLDALDELTKDELGIVRGLIESWSRQRGPHARCMITSRIAGYTGSPLPDATEVELQPFTPGDVAQVIRAWQLPAAAARELMGRASDPAVAAMARVPLLLAMLCALASEQPAGSELPRTRGELYGRVLRWFLTRPHRSADNPTTQPLTDIQVEALLELLAPVAFTFATCPEGWTDLMPAKDLLNAIRAAGPAFTDLRRTPAQVLRDLSADAGILVPDRDPTQGRSPRYLFLHRTFAEYLVARHLATLTTGNYLAVVAEHQWFDPDWENVIPMLGGQLSSVGARQLVAHLLASDPDPFWHALLTAMQVAGERPDADTTLTGKQSAGLAQATRMLICHEFGRTLISDRIARLTHMPQSMREALLANLNDPSQRTRELAVKVLAGRDGQDVTAALLARLDDPDSFVRSTAMEVLGRRDGEDVTAALLARIDHPNAVERKHVQGALAGRDGQDVTAALLARIDHPDGWERFQAVEMLAGREGHHVTAALLLACRDHPDAFVRQRATFALAGREGQDVTAALLALFDHDALVRERTAMQALKRREGEDVTAALLARLDYPDADVRKAAVYALTGREGQNVTAGLLARLDDPDAHVREHVVRALAGRDGQDVTAALLDRLHDPDAYVRERAAKALAGREGQDVTVALLARLDDPDAFVRKAAVYALAGREGKDVTAALLARLDDPHVDVRTAAVFTLAGREGQDVTAALLARLDGPDRPDDPETRVRRAAVEALATREGQDVTAALLAHLGDREAFVSVHAADALAGREGEDITAALLAHLHEPNAQVRHWAMDALSKRGSSRDLLALVQGINRLGLPPSAWLNAAYRLTTAFYHTLSAENREMTRAAMGRITAPPQDG
jgi:HEAT repeat protein